MLPLRIHHFKVVSRKFQSTYRATQGHPPCPALTQKVSETYGRPAQILFETRLSPTLPPAAGKSTTHLARRAVFGVLSSRTFSSMNAMATNDFDAALAGALPSAPPWPCPILNESEINSYLPSLFSRNWSLARTDKNMPILSCKYKLKGYKHILNFVQWVGELAQEEDHHPEITFNARSVTVRVYTHSAYRTTDKSPDVKIKGSGITTRDIRFAILVERLVDGLEKSEAIVDRFNSGASFKSLASTIQPSDIFEPKATKASEQR